MKASAVAVLILGVSMLGPSRAFGDADDQKRIGQYFCIVDNAVGINSDKDRTHAGNVTLPDKDKKFFVRIKRIERDQLERDLCVRTANSFIKSFNDGTELDYDISDLYGTLGFGPMCLAKYVAEIPMGDAYKPDKVWSYYGLNAYYFKGLDEFAKFSLFGNDKFRLTFQYDSGPTLQEGRCERIQQK